MAEVCHISGWAKSVCGHCQCEYCAVSPNLPCALHRVITETNEGAR